MWVAAGAEPLAHSELNSLSTGENPENSKDPYLAVYTMVSSDSFVSMPSTQGSKSLNPRPFFIDSLRFYLLLISLPW